MGKGKPEEVVIDRPREKKEEEGIRKRDSEDKRWGFLCLSSLSSPTSPSSSSISLSVNFAFDNSLVPPPPSPSGMHGLCACMHD